MKKYILTDTSEQTVVYTCEVEAHDKEEAIEKAEQGYNLNWEKQSTDCNSNCITAEESTKEG